MLRYLIEREMPAVGDLTSDHLAALAHTFNTVGDSLGVPFTWVTSYIAGDKMYCVHETDDPDAVLEHARRAGVPADRISLVVCQLSPQSAASTTGGLAPLRGR